MPCVHARQPEQYLCMQIAYVGGWWSRPRRAKEKQDRVEWGVSAHTRNGFDRIYKHMYLQCTPNTHAHSLTHSLILPTHRHCLSKTIVIMIKRWRKENEFYNDNSQKCHTDALWWAHMQGSNEMRTLDTAQDRRRSWINNIIKVPFDVWGKPTPP